MQPLHSGIISIPGTPKTWTWKRSPTGAPKITDKSQKCAQSGSQEAPQMTLKSVDPSVEVYPRPLQGDRVYPIPLPPFPARPPSSHMQKIDQGSNPTSKVENIAFCQDVSA